jgi:hypothetical protein
MSYGRAKEEAKRERKRSNILAHASLIGSAAIGFYFNVLWACPLALVALWLYVRWVFASEWALTISKRTRFLAQYGSLALFVAALWYPAERVYRVQMANKSSGDLRGAGEVFTDTAQRAMPWIQIGDSKSVFVPLPPRDGQPYPIFQWFYDAGFKVEFGKNGPLVTTPIRDRFGNLVVDVKQNHWTVYPPFCSDKNYTADALEVLDSSGHVILQLRLLPDRVQIQGEWWDNQGNGRRLMRRRNTENGEIIPLGPQNQHNDELIEPMFKYKSADHWGEFSN